MEKNNTRRYLKYAVGEIALVVIGILIALQINNWNEYRHERQLEKELLLQLQSEYESNLTQLEDKVDLRNDIIHASSRILEYMNRPAVRVPDSVSVLVGITVLAPTYDAIVNDIISSGRIQLIQNGDLREKLTRFTSDVIQVSEDEVIWKEYIIMHYFPTLIQYNLMAQSLNSMLSSATFSTFQLDGLGISETDLNRRVNTRNFDNLFEDPTLESHVSASLYFAILVNSQSESLRNRIMDILDLIEFELNNM